MISNFELWVPTDRGKLRKYSPSKKKIDKFKENSYLLYEADNLIGKKKFREFDYYERYGAYDLIRKFYGIIIYQNEVDYRDLYSVYCSRCNLLY